MIYNPLPVQVMLQGSGFMYLWRDRERGIGNGKSEKDDIFLSAVWL
jgi:hypothetical protein